VSDPPNSKRRRTGDSLLLFRTTTVQVLPLLAGMIGLSFLFQRPLLRLQGLAPLLMTTL